MEEKLIVDNNYKFIIMPILSSIMTLLSQVIENNFAKILFLLISLTTIIFYYKNTPLLEKKKKIIFGVLISIITVTLLYPYIKTKSFETYVSTFNIFLSSDRENKTYDKINTQLNDISSNVNSLKESTDNLNMRNEEVFNKMIDIDSYIDKMMSISELNLFKKNKNVSGIAEAKDFIIKAKNESFLELDFNNINEIEQIGHFYKMKLSGDTARFLYYSNIIEAFRLLGIDIDKYSINEMTLLYWDLQYLCSLVNVQKEIQSKLSDPLIDNEQIHENLKFEFENYKIKSGDYRDKTFYDGWRLSYENESYSKIYDRINYRIENVLNAILKNSK